MWEPSATQTLTYPPLGAVPVNVALVNQLSNVTVPELVEPSAENVISMGSQVPELEEHVRLMLVTRSRSVAVPPAGQKPVWQKSAVRVYVPFEPVTVPLVILASLLDPMATMGPVNWKLE